jgi:hypothetical protein
MAFGSMFLGAGYAIAKTDYVYEGHVLATTASGIICNTKSNCGVRPYTRVRLNWLGLDWTGLD